MLTIVSLTIGLVIWIVLWAIGVKAFDSFLVTIALVLPAAIWQIYGSGIKKLLGADAPSSF
jgi:hypothetical protein